MTQPKVSLRRFRDSETDGGWERRRKRKWSSERGHAEDVTLKTEPQTRDLLDSDVSGTGPEGLRGTHRRPGRKTTSRVGTPASERQWTS